MTQQSFEAQGVARVELVECGGSLWIESWDQPRVAFESEEEPQAVEHEGVIKLEQIRKNLRVWVPARSEVVASMVRGNVEARGIAALRGARINGSLKTEGVANLQHDQIDGNCVLDDAQSATIGKVRGMLFATNVDSLVVDKVSGNCNVDAAGSRVRVAKVDGSLQVAGGEQTVVEGKRVHGNLKVADVARVDLDGVSASAAVQRVRGDVRIDNVGGNCEAKDVAGSVMIGNVGGSANLQRCGSLGSISNVGGNLTMTDVPLAAGQPPERSASIMVGGSARAQIADGANLTIQALVGGSLRVSGLNGGWNARRGTIIYGDGSTPLQLTVGGNLELQGGGTPRIESATGRSQSANPAPGGEAAAGWDHVGHDIGEAMNRMGDVITRTVSEGVNRVMTNVFSGPGTPATGQTVRMERPTAAGSPAPAPAGGRPRSGEAERVTVLRMIAEGRITPEQGAQLLDALG